MTVAKRGALPLLLAAAAFAYLYGLGGVPFVGADEPRYAQVAREMHARGDLVTPTLDGRTWFEKPALVYWAEIAGFKLLGVSELSARLGMALAGWLTVLLVGWVASRAERDAGGGARGLGLAAAAVAASSAGLLVFSRGVNFDVMVTATVTLSLACFFAAEIKAEARRPTLLLAGFYAGVGLSLLAKGLVGVVVPFGTVGLYFLLLRRWPRQWKSLLWGVPLALGVAALWYAPVTARHGRAFLEEFFVQHHFARYTSNKYHHPQPFYFYLLILPLLALPWTPLLAGALAGVGRWRWRGGLDAEERLRVFALAWAVVPVAFFSLSGSKLPGYILPALPGAALLASVELARLARGRGGAWPLRATGALVLAFAALVVGFALRTGEVGVWCAAAVAAPLAAAGVWTLIWGGSRAWAAGAVCCASLLALVFAADCAAGGAARRESVRDLMREAERRGLGDAPVVGLHTIERSSEFYAAGRLVYGSGGQPLKLEGAWQVEDYARRSGACVLVFVPVEYAPQLYAQFGADTELIGDNGAVALVAVRRR